MHTKQHILNCILAQGMLPLFFYKDKQVSVEVVRALYKAGVRVIEYTNRGEAALENFKALKLLQRDELHDLILGIGTIKTGDEANAFFEAGADFLISPVVNTEIAEIASSRNMLWV